MQNLIRHGDNLDQHRYLPAHNSLLREEAANGTDAQLPAFEDIWHWGPWPHATCRARVTNTARQEGCVPDKVSTIIAALRSAVLMDETEAR